MDYAAIAQAVLRRPEVRRLCVKMPFSSPCGERNGTHECLILRTSESQGGDLTSSQVKGRYVQFMLLWTGGSAEKFPRAYETVVYRGLTYAIQETRSVEVGPTAVAWTVLATIE